MVPVPESLAKSGFVWSGVPVPQKLTFNSSPSAKVKTQSLGFKAGGAVRKSTVCSTTIVQKRSRGTSPTPSIGSSNAHGVAVGISLKVVPKIPPIGIVRGGTTPAVAKTTAAQPSARPSLLNRLRLVIMLLLSFSEMACQAIHANH